MGAIDQGEALIVKTAAGLAAAVGTEFFQALVEYLALELHASRTTVAGIKEQACRVVVLAEFPDSRDPEHSEYLLAGTPEGNLLHSGSLVHQSAGDGEEWSGVLLIGSSGQAVGVLSVVYRPGRSNPQAIDAALSRFAPRAAAEIEREQSLRESELRCRELVQYSGDGTWCLEFDPPVALDLPEDKIAEKLWEARIALANDAMARMLGYSAPADIAGRRLGEFRPLLPHAETQLRQHLKRGLTPAAVEFVVCRDGEESWWESSALPIVAGGALVRIWETARGISQRKREEQRLQELNQNLKRQLAERTAQLAAANQELEAFSYSISHDLRAAIQGILACSRIVVEDHGDKLDETGKLWLSHVAEDAAQLDGLTMALLDLSLVSRASLCRRSVDLSAMAEAIASRLSGSDPARKANFRIAPGMIVSADPSLLGNVMDHLLNNAWKFTKTREVAEIEVGVELQKEEPVYFVRDNGVGFNMKYAEKLFGAFQRMHRAEDFAGKGIGLATVRRVIHRHGGQVWADAKVNSGATIFFTLGRSEGA